MGGMRGAAGVRGTGCSLGGEGDGAALPEGDRCTEDPFDLTIVGGSRG